MGSTTTSRRPTLPRRRYAEHVGWTFLVAVVSPPEPGPSERVARGEIMRSYHFVVERDPGTKPWSATCRAGQARTPRALTSTSRNGACARSSRCSSKTVSQRSSRSSSTMRTSRSPSPWSACRPQAPAGRRAAEADGFEQVRQRGRTAVPSPRRPLHHCALPPRPRISPTLCEDRCRDPLTVDELRDRRQGRHPTGKSSTAASADSSCAGRWADQARLTEVVMGAVASLRSRCGRGSIRRGRAAVHPS